MTSVMKNDKRPIQYMMKKVNWLFHQQKFGWFPTILPTISPLCFAISLWYIAVRYMRLFLLVIWVNSLRPSDTKCISKLTMLTSICLDNCLLPTRHQAIIGTNAGILSTGHLGTNFSEILIKIHKCSCKKIICEMVAILSQPQCVKDLLKVFDLWPNLYVHTEQFSYPCINASTFNKIITPFVMFSKSLHWLHLIYTGLTTTSSWSAATTLTNN